MMSFSRLCELFSSHEKEDIEEAKRIIENESLNNAADVSKNTLLHHASIVGNHEIVQFLVYFGSKVNAQNDIGQTPLVSTLESCNPSKEVIEILLEAGADVHKQLFWNDRDAFNIINSPEWLNKDTKRFEIYKMIMEAFGSFTYFELLKVGDEKIIKMLLETNIDLPLTDSEGNTLDHILARNPNPGVMTALRNRNIDMNARDNEGRTPLMHAATYGYPSSVQFLLDEGADIEATDYEGKTALYLVYDNIADGDYDECIQLLLEHGANAQIVVHSATIFDLVLDRSDRFLNPMIEPEYWAIIPGELSLAHLALQEAKEGNIEQLIYSEIDSHIRFKTYFQECKQQLKTKIYRSVTLFDILSASERKLERYLRDKELASKMSILRIAQYFDTILQKKLSKATSMVKLRETAAPIVGELIKIDYDSYPSIMDAIVSYLKEEDLECLISIQNELPSH